MILGWPKLSQSKFRKHLFVTLKAFRRIKEKSSQYYCIANTALVYPCRPPQDPFGHEDGLPGVVDGEDDGDVLLGWLLQAGSVGTLPLDTKLCQT